LSATVDTHRNDCNVIARAAIRQKHPEYLLRGIVRGCTSFRGREQ
jgi:hypothetical protein